MTTETRSVQVVPVLPAPADSLPRTAGSGFRRIDLRTIGVPYRPGTTGPFPTQRSEPRGLTESIGFGRWTCRRPSHSVTEEVHLTPELVVRQLAKPQHVVDRMVDSARVTVVISVENFSVELIRAAFRCQVSRSSSGDGDIVRGDAAPPPSRAAPAPIRTGRPTGFQSTPRASTWSTCSRNAGISTRNAASIVG